MNLPTPTRSALAVGEPITCSSATTAAAAGLLDKTMGPRGLLVARYHSTSRKSWLDLLRLKRIKRHKRKACRHRYHETHDAPQLL